MKQLITFMLITLAIISITGCKIVGTVTEEGVCLEDVTMTLEGNDQRTVITNEKGKYIFNRLAPGDYIITPALDGYRFEPETTMVTEDQFTQRSIRFDFQAFPDSALVCNDSSWEGDYTIDDAEDLENLSGYSTVTGNLTITNISSLEGMQCLTTIGGNFLINNNNLVTLDGLNGLETINSSFFIDTNPALEDILSGLENLTTIGGFLLINNNSNLPQSQTQDLIDQLDNYTGMGWF